MASLQPLVLGHTLKPETQISRLRFNTTDRILLKDMLNESYGIAISADDAKKWQTIGDIVEMVERKTR